MCLLIHRPAGQAVPESTLDSGLSGNPDGWGIVEPGYGVQRGLDRRSFWTAYDRLGTGEAFIHFRFATHGPANMDNCHPFEILGGRYAVLHNGIIDIPISDKSRSDTWHFAELVLAPMLRRSPRSFGKAKLEKIIAGMIGTSKLAIVRDDGKSTIVNRDMGSDVNGVWLSNTHCLRPDPWFSWRDNPWKEDEAFGLDSLAGYTREELANLCREDPDGVAWMIDEYLSEKYARDIR